MCYIKSLYLFIFLLIAQGGFAQIHNLQRAHIQGKVEQ
nr:hypothetical protein [Mucilaginibacter sp. SP1R1]